MTTRFRSMRLHFERTLITTFTTMILTYNLTFAFTLVSTLSNKKHWELSVESLNVWSIYLSPLAPVPRRTSELVTVSNINRFQRLITILIVNELIIHRLRVDAANAANLFAAFLAARHRALAPSSGSPFILRHCGSGLNTLNVVVKYWRVFRDSWSGDLISGCRNIWIRCFLNLMKETTPYRRL
jgi:hypothetical protein